MRLVIDKIILSVVLLSYLCSGQSCDQYTTQFACESSGACRWWTQGGEYCRCASEVKLDILFGVDTSGSIGWDGFQIQKQFLKNLTRQGVNNGSRVGFYMFNTEVNTSRGIQSWDSQALLSYIDGIYWTAGWTNTPSLLALSLQEFERTYDPDRQQVLMMVTDGNPCLPETLGGCPQSVCQYAAQVKSAGIRVVIIGVGDGLNTLYVSCLTQSDDDFIPVTSFSTDDFNSIMGSLSGILCPISKEFKLTEVKAAKKDGTYNYRLSRFIEIYNTGVGFNLQDITLSGMVSGTGPDVDVQQGQYIVFYDASDEAGNLALSAVTCHLCGDACDLSGCGIGGSSSPYTAGSNTGDKGYAGYCTCGNAVYVACKNSADPSGATCSGNVWSGTGCGTTTGNCANSNSACNSGCTFDNSVGKTGWTVTISDASSSKVIDSVSWDGATWITTDDGYSYELISKGFDNQIGDNWAQSCSIYGTPGSDPTATCDQECQVGGCGAGGTCSLTTQLCECDKTTGYYPQCTSPTSCTKCLKVPQVEDCQVLWTKNGTDRYAAFSWTDSGRSGQTEYQISYFSDSQNGGTATASTLGELYKEIDDYWPGNNTFGGFVQTVIEQCVQIGTSTAQTCESYYSAKTWCTVITSEPTVSPTPAPSPTPTESPTGKPSVAPTWSCPRYWWINKDVCDPERCVQCENSYDDACCLAGTPIFERNTQDPDRSHLDAFRCYEDSQLLYPDKRSKGEDAAGRTSGYLLTPGVHTFHIGIRPPNYYCTMDIFWKLQFNEIDCSYDARRRRLQSSSLCDDSSTDMNRAGLDIDVTSGWLTVHGGGDYDNTTVQFEVSRLSCAQADSLLNSGSASGISTTSSISDNSCWDSVAIYGELIIVNATSRCDPTCLDGRIYPLRIPLWYNYAAAVFVPPGGEKELPAWLWWLVAALAIFLLILAFLIYKYWWKNKATGAALGAVQADLDAAVMESETGFAGDLGGNNVGFNPLATGYNANAPAGPMAPNAPPQQGGNGPNFIRPNAEKNVFRREFGPQYGQQFN